MRIGVDASCWVNERGYGRYARGLLTALTQHTEHEYIFFADEHSAKHSNFPSGIDVRTTMTSQAVNSAARADSSRSVSDMIAMSRMMQQTPLDILFFPSVFTYVPVWTSAKIWVAIHDVIAEQYPQIVFPQRKNRWLWMLKNWLSRQQADKIITVSDHAKRGIQNQFGWSADDIAVVGEAPDAVFQKLSLEQVQITQTEFNLVDMPYFVCLGGLNPHKNIPLLIAEFAKLHREEPELRLVLIGPGDDDKFTPGIDAVRTAITTHDLPQEAIIFAGYLPDERVAALLNGAIALVLPSLMEGYGLGAIEAAACGTPVIVTQHSPMPEIIADGGIFIDPTDGAALYSALNTMLTNEEKRDAYAACAYQRASQLTWDAAADAFLKLVERA